MSNLKFYEAVLREELPISKEWAGKGWPSLLYPWFLACLQLPDADESAKRAFTLAMGDSIRDGVLPAVRQHIPWFIERDITEPHVSRSNFSAWLQLQGIEPSPLVCEWIGVQGAAQGIAMEKAQGMTADDLAAQMPLDQWIPISEAAKILGGGAVRVKSLMDLAMRGGLLLWSHSCPHLEPSKVTYHKIGVKFDLPYLMEDTDPATVMIQSKDVLWRWCVEVEELLQDVDSEGIPPKEQVKSRFRWLHDRAYQLKTGIAPGSQTTPTARWPWGEHHTEALGRLAAAAHKFWVNHDPSDTSTVPKNADVSNWLQTEHDVSKNQADAIASILRMDGLPTGPRR